MKNCYTSVMVFLCFVLMIGCNASKKFNQDEINDIPKYNNMQNENNRVSKNDGMQNDINLAVSYLGNTVQKGFKKAERWNEGFYTNDNFVIYNNDKYRLYVKEDIVIASQIDKWFRQYGANYFDTLEKNRNDAKIFLEKYIDFFVIHEKWQIEETPTIKIYKNNEIYVLMDSFEDMSGCFSDGYVRAIVIFSLDRNIYQHSER